MRLRALVRGPPRLLPYRSGGDPLPARAAPAVPAIPLATGPRAGRSLGGADRSLGRGRPRRGWPSPSGRPGRCATGFSSNISEEKRCCDRAITRGEFC
ncbi:unnamed protein product [Pleuronectes platessa]|uniref:Uncharacterized protein n=1 Tax=Pleuronectes platessa TaxID=8262 RepID=A0A9N7Y5D2_PLEPL|nr:unnamed protein product [Pleuronectes platessa]